MSSPKFKVFDEVIVSKTSSDLDGLSGVVTSEDTHEEFVWVKLEDGRKFLFYEPELKHKNPTKKTTSKEQIETVCDNLKSLLLYKNEKYGDSALHPINVFSKASAETGLLQRLDDKIARIKNSPELRQNDICDVVGYCVLLCASKGWTDFEQFKD